MKKIKKNNGKRHSQKIKERGIQLRKNGWTHREIMKELGISLGSAFLWTKGILLSDEQCAAIEKRRIQAVFTKERRQKLSKQARKSLRQYFYRRKYTNHALLKKIKDFYKEHGRIPMKREFNSFRMYRDRFGSWNNAIVSAGFTPNPSSARHYVSCNGHICDSLAERIIDNFFFENKIEHARSIPYPGYSKFKADFCVNTILIEYFGRVGLRDYDEIIARKRALCWEKNIRLIELYPSDILEKKKLPVLLAEFIEEKRKDVPTSFLSLFFLFAARIIQGGGFSVYEGTMHTEAFALL